MIVEKWQEKEPASPRVPLHVHVENLAKLDAVDGEAVYYAGTKGDFYKIYEIVIVEGIEEDFLAMLKNNAPTVRVMGALCLAQKDLEKHKKQIQSLYKDDAVVGFFRGGCVGTSKEVGSIVKLIVSNPYILEWHRKPQHGD